MQYQNQEVSLTFKHSGNLLDVSVYVDSLSVMIPVKIKVDGITKQSQKRVNELTEDDVFAFIKNNPIDFRGTQYPSGMDNIIAEAINYRNSK